VAADGAQTWGWFEDPYREHDYRYLSEGVPTKLVRDSGHESFDPPPDYPMPFALVPVAVDVDRRSYGSDLRRADDAERQAPYDRRASCHRAMSAIVGFRSPG
jgi:hypothetical protein